MKNLLLSMSFLLFAGLNSMLTAQPQYYNYNTAGSGSNSFPYNIAAGKEVQLLYLAGDFNQPTPAPAGNITSVSVYISSYGLPATTYTDFTIKMAQSTLTSFDAGGFYSGALTTVYYRASVSLTGAASSWMTITLDVPFLYDPTQSLIIDIGQCAAVGGTGTYFSSAFTTLTGNRRNWSVGGCPFAYYGPNSAIYHMGVNVAPASGPPIVVTTAASGVTSTIATLNGTANANGATTAVSFEYGLTTAYGTTVPGSPPSVTGNSALPVFANITGLLPGNTYHYRIIGTNSNGTVNGFDVTFITPPVLPVVVTTPATGVSSTGATLTGTVNPGGASTTVTFEYGQTTTYGTTVPGVPGTMTGNSTSQSTATIGGLIVNTTYHYRIKGSNSVGNVNGNDMTFLTTLCPSPGPAGPITGPTTGCGNSLGNIYTVAAIANATGYIWTVPPGANITLGLNTNSITVTLGNTSGTVTVTGTNTCGNGSTSSLNVTINPAPLPTITGPNSMCVNSGYYYYSTQGGMSNYTWTVSSGGTITWGLGTNTVEVIWPGSGAQSVSVNYTNAGGCPAGTPSVLPVTVTPLPGSAGPVTGNASACAGALGVAYSVQAISNASTYVWLLPAGATISSGALTNSITVNFAPDAVSGNITVYGNNLCGNGTTSPPLAVTVDPLPVAAGAITGPASVCLGGYGDYTVTPITNATGYTWTIPSGAQIESGTNTYSIHVYFSASAVAGNITVTGTNACGNGQVSPDLSVTVHPVPPAPVITADGYILTSDAPSGNQWYMDGNIITSATSQTYTASQSGIYTDIVTLFGCNSAISNPIEIVMVGLSDNSNNSISVYPVPNDGSFTVAMASPVQETFTIQVFNSLGVLIRELSEIPVKGTVKEVLDLKPLARGIYTLVIRTNTTQIIRKVIVNN